MARAAAHNMVLADIGGAMRRVWRRMMRDARLTVPVCIILICGSFAAAALIQMRLERSHALAQASAFEQDHANGLAHAAASALDRYARLGRLYADTLYPALARAEPAIANIALFDARGQTIATLKPGAVTAPPAFKGERHLFAWGLALKDGPRRIAVLFDTAALAPGAQLVPPEDVDTGAIAAPLPGWPLSVVTRIDEAGALASWYGVLPLYLFVILGPALAGGWLAALFVGAFERHDRAARSLRALRAARPVEARLLVRLAQAERGAAEALRAKSEFMAHMSHELRTPLNAVIGFSDIIAGGLFGPPGHPKYGEYARDIAFAGRALHGRIDSILEFANIEAGRYPLTGEAVDLPALVQTVVEEQQGRAFSRRIALSLDFAEPGQVRADPAALRRILVALLDNALAYTAEGGWVRLEIRFEAAAGVLRLADSGTGFSPGEQARAGRPFQRFDRPGATTGAGLGLAIAMELARRMGGTMQLSGAPRQGAQMALRLPMP
ncbi:MAG: HAMP domain-containing histidine kinase [Alphaproteobacteria bacterium]|nr:HAMP domain-containing histidine kinase [Alphaproteobacteria bacterium]